MHVTFDPEDGSDKSSWEFDPDDVLSSEAMAIERAYGESWEQWLNALRISNAKARGVLLWHLQRQTHKTLKLADLPDFRMRQLKVQMSVAELRALSSRFAKMKIDEDTREQLLAAIDVDIRDAMEREGGGVLVGEIEGAELPKPA